MVAIGRRWWIVVLALAVVFLAILWAMNRPPICTCGYVTFWYGSVNGPGNSQHIADWYTLSHIIHGMIFYALLWWVGSNWSMGLRLALATIIEGSWELLENSPMIIDRYRQATIGIGYSGDSIINSMCDIGWMILGFLVALRLPWKWTLAIALLMELVALVAIRDNLALNILMLLYPVEAVKLWQGG